MNMDYNKSGLFVLLTTVIGSCIWIIWLVYGVKPIDLGEMQPAHKTIAKVPKDLTQKVWVSHSTWVQKGKTVYQTYCATCHGQKGLGDGPAGKALKPLPRNLVEGKWTQGGSSIKLYQTITNGIQGTAMVAFSYLAKEERWSLVHYIRSITKNEVKDDLQKLEDFAKTAP